VLVAVLVHYVQYVYKTQPLDRQRQLNSVLCVVNERLLLAQRVQHDQPDADFACWMPSSSSSSSRRPLSTHLRQEEQEHQLLVGLGHRGRQGPLVRRLCAWLVAAALFFAGNRP
jgi:hypothetical protein